MRVLLIYPPITLQERYSSEIGHAGGRQIPLGVYYLENRELSLVSRRNPSPFSERLSG